MKNEGQIVESTDSINKNGSSDANNNQFDNAPTPTSQRPDSQNGLYYDKFDEQHRKLFLGYGLDLNISEENLEDFFKKFGEVEKVIIKRDAVTGKPRGFAFITMEKSEDVENVLNACPLTIDDKAVDVKLAKSRPISKKIFVGGIDPNLTKEEITSYFSTYGKVVDIELPFDRIKKKRREFCFIIFETEDSANQASVNAKQTIFGRECDIKKACPQPIAQQQKRHNLQHSYNSTNTQSNYYGLNQSKNKTTFSSPISMKSGNSTGYRGGYRGKNPMNRSNNGYYQNGRRSVDSQSYGTIYEHNNTSFNSNFAARKGGGHQSNTGGRNQAQYGMQQNGKMHNNHHGKQSQHTHQSINQQHQQYYDQMIPQQQYYGQYQVPFTNDYYAQPQYAQQAQQGTAQHTGTTNTALNNYGQPTNQLQNNYAAAYNQNAIDPAQYHLFYQQYQYSMSQQAQQQLNNNLAQAITATNLPQAQQQQANAGDFQTLDERYYQEQQKQFESNLMNNYEKFDPQPEDMNSYQSQLINNANLLNVQYQ